MRFQYVLFLLFPVFLTAQSVSLDYYLPKNISYNSDIPKPIDVIGHEVGEWHITHDKLLFYLKALAESSDRITLEERGKTYEGRQLPLLTITSPENHKNIETIRKEHIALTDGEVSDVSGMPIVVYQGFSIHGNEASATNAAVVYAYYLAAAEGNEIETALKNSVILLDACMNPDGLQRFAYWANIHKSQNLNPDSNDREYREVWPGGRTNHYWFDMNRDWLPVQLPESKARVESFHKWLPNILTDHHEMGTNSTFFFQPGEPDRVNPLTPKRNQELTKEIGNFHAAALDKIGSLYYSEEGFDDYYYGKGSTFPDVNGSIGILFEQGSSRGHIQESENGILTFPFTIRNQFTTCISTLTAANALREKILEFQKSYYANLRQEGSRMKTKGIVFGDPKDISRTNSLAEILYRHKIRFHNLKQDMTVGGKTFKKDHAFIVPMDQKNPRLINAMFEKRTTFKDSIFYDVSAWTFPLAFNLDYGSITSLANAGDAITQIPKKEARMPQKSNYAYLFEWHDYNTPKALNQIVEKGLRAKVARTPFTLESNDYDYGTIMVPVQDQKLDADELFEFLKTVASKTGIEISSVSTGQTKGIDLGSNDFEPIKKQKVAVLVGDGIRSYDAGEIWHLFDIRYDIKITKLDKRSFNNVELERYTDLIIPSGWGGTILDETGTKKVKEWIKNGGTLIGYRNVANWMDKNEIMKLKMRKDTLVAKNISFDKKRAFRGAQVTGGAIFEAKIDRSHPINFGYSGNTISLFRNTNIYLEPAKQSYDNPIQYTNNPLLSGYISEENAELIKSSVPFKAKRMGKGRVLLFTDNTNFRAFWYGTNKLMMNAVFFGPLM